MNQVKKSDYAYTKFKKDLNYTFSLSGSVSLVVLVLYALSALFLYIFNSNNISVIWSFVLIFVFTMIIVGLLSPFLYSFFANNAILEGPDREKVGIKSLFKTSKFGFFAPYKGLLNTWLTLLISIIIFLFTSTIVNTLILAILYYSNGAYKTFFDSLNTSDYNAIMDQINKNSSLFAIPSMVSNLVALCLSLFFFLRNILINIFKYSIAGLFLGIPRKALNYIFKDTIKKHKKEFLKGFYSHAWIILVVFFVFLIGSYFGLYFGFSSLSEKNSSSFIMIISLTSVVVALIVSLIFYPILFNHYLDIFNVYRNYFVNNFVSIMTSEIKQAKEMEGNNQEFENQIKIAENKLDDFKKKMGAQDESSSNDINEENKEDHANDQKEIHDQNHEESNGEKKGNDDDKNV